MYFEFCKTVIQIQEVNIFNKKSECFSKHSDFVINQLFIILFFRGLTFIIMTIPTTVIIISGII